MTTPSNPSTPTVAGAAGVTSTESRKHHPRSPSKLQSLEACDCFKSREDVIHERAIAGTLAHTVADTLEDDDKLSDDDSAAVAECLDFAEERRRELDAAAETAWLKACESQREPPPSRGDYQVREIKEEYLPIDDCTYDDTTATTAGYADHIFISWDERHAELIDWKFGKWAVERADNNVQGFAYALGLFKRFPKLLTVHIWFKQPHLDYVTEVVINRSQLPDIYLRIKVIVERAYIAEKRKAANSADVFAAFSSASPHTPICLFCGDIGRCPKVGEIALNIAKKYHPVKFPDTLKLHELISPSQTALMLELVGVVKIFCEQARRHITDRCLRGDSELPEDYIIKTKNGNRKIVDMDKFREVALKYLSDKDYQLCLDASFGNIESKISELAPRGSKEKTVEEFKKALEEAGAVERGQPYSFLQQKADDKKQKPKTNT